MEGLIPELKKAIKTSGSADYASSGSRIYVHVHHPGQTQNGRAKYVDDALAAVLSAQSDQPR
jgi:hypothetical protein